MPMSLTCGRAVKAMEGTPRAEAGPPRKCRGGLAQEVLPEGKILFLPTGTNVSESAPDDNQGEFVQSLERGLAVIRAFGFHRVSLTITDVAQATGLTRATARRFLLTLVRMGYVRNDGRDYSLRPRVLELGYAYLSGLTLPEAAEPFLNDLVMKVQESTSIAVRDGDEIVYVAHAAPQRVMTINVPVGGRDPLYCTALGRVLLAAQPDEEIDRYLETTEFRVYTEATVTDPDQLRQALTQVREDGYSLIEDELEDGLVALAVPVRDAAGTVIAAMNVCAYSLRTGPDGLRNDYLPLLRETVAEIEQEMRAATQASFSPG
jgi:IclR family transcriptional regulator, pca regulon regulatory protein